MEQAEHVVDKPKRNKHYNTTKNHLINYRIYLATVERKEKRLREIGEVLDGVRGTDYSKERVQSSPVDSMLDKMLEEKIQIENDLRRVKALVRDIDRARRELDEKQDQIIEMKYIERYSSYNTWIKVAKAVGYEERQARRKAKDAILQITVVIYGLD